MSSEMQECPIVEQLSSDAKLTSRTVDEILSTLHKTGMGCKMYQLVDSSFFTALGSPVSVCHYKLSQSQHPFR